MVIKKTTFNDVNDWHGVKLKLEQATKIDKSFM